VLFESVPVPIFVWDTATGRHLAVNEACVRKYGWSREELLQMTVYDLRPPGDVDRLKRSIATHRTETPYVGVWTHRNRDGETFDIEVTAHEIDFAGRPARLSVVSDITERRRLEDQLRQLQKVEALGLLAGGVAHDFNNLLGVMIGAAELARREATTEAGREHLLEIEAAAKRAAELARKLLAFSRKEASHIWPLDLGEAIDEFLQLLRRIIGEDVELTVGRAREPLVVEIEASQLEQILLNLCTNARQAMPSGGRITIDLARVSIDAAGAAGERVAAVGEYAEIRVSDTGVGMDATTLTRIFEPFFTTKTEGTGLGLAMVRRIVHRRGGLLRVESQAGAGTTVRVLLPLVEPSETTEKKPMDGAPAKGGGETILIAEDEPSLRRLLASTLHELGYEVVIAQNGEEAVRAFEASAGKVALAILDVVMPGMGGLQAYERMRTIAPDIKVVFTTGYDPDGSQVSEIVGKDRGAGPALLAKPFSLTELGHTLRAVLDGSRGSAGGTGGT
jgi:two-component system, cell cycle sensor histidine kinase and response regulator CckA